MTAPLQPRLIDAARNSGRPVLDAGRGQPDWIATTPRAAFFRLGEFAVGEADRTGTGQWGSLPPRDGIAQRLDDDLALDDSTGARFLRAAIAYTTRELGFDADAVVHELVVAVLGGAYPTPTRFLPHLETIAGRYLVTMIGRPHESLGNVQLFATEGGAAAMAYVFKTLRANEIVGPGDAIAIATPVFTPYLQIPVLENYGFRVVAVQSAHNAAYRFTDEFFETLLDPSIKVFFVINPGNPDTRAIRPQRLQQLSEFVRTRRPDLVIVADTAYATFVDDFHSIMSVLPRNTLLIHSFSKNFGATGNRLGFVALHRGNVLDDILRAQPHSTRAQLQQRYASVTDDASSLSFLSRVVAESREVALHNIAGLSTVDQVQLSLFALAFLSDDGHAYVVATRDELAERATALFEPLGVDRPGGSDTLYYALIDVREVARARHGESFTTWLEGNVEPEDLLLRLASEHGVIVQSGASFHSEPWDLRVSLASLPADAHAAIGAALVEVLDEYFGESPPLGSDS